MNMRQVRSIAILAVIIAGSLSLAGCPRVPATCNDGEIAAFDAASDSWACDTRGHVMLDADGTQIGPLVSYNLLYAVVAVTLPDPANNPRTVLLISNGERLFGSPLPSVYFTQPACPGDMFVPVTSAHPQLAPLYEYGYTDNVPSERLYVVDQGTTVTPTLVSGRAAINCTAQGPPDPTADFHPVDLLAADLQALYPGPHTLQAQ